jgi:hypothetical protein
VRLSGNQESRLSEKTDISPVNGQSAFDLGIMHVNRFEVVCLQSPNIVLGQRRNSFCPFFRTNVEGGRWKKNFRDYNFFLFQLIKACFLDGIKLVSEPQRMDWSACASKHQPGF